MSPNGVQSESQPPLRVGLTGGIASGKSTVADMFAGLGARIIDTDQVAREVVAPGEPALDEIREAFGDDVIGKDGGLDRSRMRRIIFADDQARARLEGILHPRIGAATLAQSSTQAGPGGAPYQMIVVPLLVGSPLRTFLDRVVTVDCDEATQIQRLLARDAESESQAKRMLAAQANREERLAIADDVILNDGDLTATLQQVQTLHRRYLALARKRGQGEPPDRGEPREDSP